MNRRCARQRLPGRLKRHHEAVAFALHFEAPVGLHLLSDDGVVLAEDVHEPRVAQPVRQRGGAFDVAEHDGDGAVGRRVRLKVRLLCQRFPRHGVDRCAEVGERDALGLKLEG